MKRSATKPSSARPQPAKDVGEFMRALDHPLTSTLQLVRVTILGASPAITEGIKWNAPSFRVQEYFATVNVYQKAGMPDCVLIILHLGAKVRARSAAEPKIKDPVGLLEWLSKDRAAVRFSTLKEAKTRQAALKAIVRQWITFL